MLKVGLHEIFEQMSYCPGETEVTLKENKEGGFSIALHRKPRSLSPTYIPFHSCKLINLNPVGDENRTTLEIFKRMVLSLSGDSSVLNDLKIFNKLEKKIQFEKPLKARFIRKCYQTIIGLKLASYKKVAAFCKETDILIFKDKSFEAASQGLLSKEKEVHKEAWVALKKELVLEWGKERVKRVTQKYKISFKENIKKETPLRRKHIKLLLIGLSDYQRSDLEASFKRLIKVAKNKLAIERLPSLELKKLQAKYPNFKDPDLQKKIRELFLSNLADSFLDLPLELQSFIQELAFLSSDELESSFLGTRKEGIVNGSQSNLRAQLIYNPSSLDEERLYLYQTIWDAPFRISEERFELFFLELMTKCLSKKELFEGCFIPYPDKEASLFYYVDMRLANGKSKLGYYLRSVFEELKDLFVFRGTSLDPSMTGALGSLLSDLYPLKPPGSLWQKASRHEENRIFSSSNKTILVSGHSLGGCLSMFASLEFFLTQNSRSLNRKFKIRTFDTPKIDEESTEKFASWCQTNQISIKHYINRKDLFPKFGGNSLLGKNARGIKGLVVLLSPRESKSPLALKSTHTHLFFKNNNFESETMAIEEYLKESSHLEKVRVFGGFFLFPMIFAFFILKRFFWGWSGSPAICKLLFLKSIQYLAKVQEK
ncbi:lipase family protein [Criblamydia sequanensis]|uniref:Lipase n=1 Tax=Candidatus Criblamydia sequanensis CRIB-18 TaxID=1437425 RepID=A0A090DYK6_9BACT|nr:hypothetical protein [Criblamydia sequanensis]CDR33789.1 putative lipase [Criblamydia sequanensis CRIB-18]